jgi:hypothetical protein
MQLTGLRLYLCAVIHPEHLPHIVDTAPQLQELWMLTVTSPGQLACITGLRSLGSLRLCVTAEAAPALRSLTALQRLTHLALEGILSDDLLAAVGQLTGLVELELWNISDGEPLQPLAALQQLTCLHLFNCTMDKQQAQVLAGLGQLRHLEAYFDSPAAAAAAGLASLEECKVEWLCSDAELQGGALVQAPGQLDTDPGYLVCFDLSSLHTLELEEYSFAMIEGEALGQQLPRCPRLTALMLHQASSQLEALQAIVALPQLQHLCLICCSKDSPLDCGRLAVLAGCSRQLRQLTLWGMAHLPESTLVALMAGLPQLRLLRLLGCPEPGALPGGCSCTGCRWLW